MVFGGPGWKWIDGPLGNDDEKSDDSRGRMNRIMSGSKLERKLMAFWGLSGCALASVGLRRGLPPPN